MNFKDIPELPRSSKTDRLHFRNSGIVVEEMEEELACGPMVRVNLLLSLMPSKLVLKELTQSPRLRVALAKGHKVAKKYRKWLQTLALGVSHLAEAAKPTVTMQHLSTMTWTQGDRCFLCLKMFRTFRKQYHCRFCGESVCGSCSSFVDMSLFNVSYESSGSSSSIIVGRCKLNLPATVDGSGRSDNSSHNASVDSTEEYLDIRGCNTCASELQMNLAIRDQCQDARMPTHYGSSNIFSQLANGCPINMGRENKFNQSFGYSSISSSPQSYPGFGNDFERDGTVSRQTGNYYQQNQQYAGQKMSLSSITSSSLSGFPNDERAQLALDTSTSLTEAVGNERLHMSFDRIPTCDLASDASLNEFLAGNSDILLLNESMFHGESATQVPSMMAIIDDSEYMDLTYNLTCRPACRNIRASYATTAATNEESNCSRFNYAGMTLQETQTAEQYVRATNATNTLRMNGRLPLTPLQPKHDPDYKQSSANVSHMVYRTTRQRRLSSSQSHKSSHSSESVRSDLIHLNDPIQAPVTQSNGFVVFSGSRQAENLNHEESDMILLNSEADNKKQSFER
ncbi:unnamed protein product [Peronospora belbahrii]|nr:unnamed protein product [Peronospora belbahrii]